MVLYLLPFQENSLQTESIMFRWLTRPFSSSANPGFDFDHARPTGQIHVRYNVTISYNPFELYDEVGDREKALIDNTNAILSRRTMELLFSANNRSRLRPLCFESI
jgi:hypothetical protein